MIKLSPQQEKFVREIIKGKSQRQAYLIAYPSSTKWELNIVDIKASQLAAEAKVRLRLEELRAPVEKKLRKTLEDLLLELDILKNDAHRAEQYAPAISSVMGQAKLLGYDKQIIEGNVTVTVMDMIKKDGKPLKYNIGKEKTNE